MGSLHPVKLEKTQMCVCTVSAQSEDSRNNSHKRVSDRELLSSSSNGAVFLRNHREAFDCTELKMTITVQISHNLPLSCARNEDHITKLNYRPQKQCCWCVVGLSLHTEKWMHPILRKKWQIPTQQKRDKRK